MCCFFFQAEDGIRDGHVTGVQTCALPILVSALDSTVEVYLANLALILIIGFFFSLLVILVSGRFLAKQAVKPIPRIVRQVKRISASNLNLRLDGAEEKDELGKLVSTFNDLLSKLEESFQVQNRFV